MDEIAELHRQWHLTRKAINSRRPASIRVPVADSGRMLTVLDRLVMVAELTLERPDGPVDAQVGVVTLVVGDE